MCHFINTGAGFFHFSKNFIAFVQLLIAIGITIHFKFRAGQFSTGVVLVYLCQTEISINTLVLNGDFYYCPVLINRNREYLI